MDKKCSVFYSFTIPSSFIHVISFHSLLVSFSKSRTQFCCNSAGQEGASARQPNGSQQYYPQNSRPRYLEKQVRGIPPLVFLLGSLDWFDWMVNDTIHVSCWKVECGGKQPAQLWMWGDSSLAFCLYNGSLALFCLCTKTSAYRLAHFHLIHSFIH